MKSDENLGPDIRAVLAGRSLEQFAGAVGCSLGTLRRWIDGTTLPRSAAHWNALEREGVPAHRIQAVRDAAAKARDAAA